MTVRAIGYLRVSSADQAADAKTSLAQQRVAIEERASIDMWFEGVEGIGKIRNFVHDSSFRGRRTG